MEWVEIGLSGIPDICTGVEVNDGNKGTDMDDDDTDDGKGRVVSEDCTIGFEMLDDGLTGDSRGGVVDNLTESVESLESSSPSETNVKQ
jgi:hypothetical protein